MPNPHQAMLRRLALPLLLALLQAVVLVLRKRLAQNLIDYPAVLSILQPFSTSLCFALISGLLWSLALSPNLSEMSKLRWLRQKSLQRKASSGRVQVVEELFIDSEEDHKELRPRKTGLLLAPETSTLLVVHAKPPERRRVIGHRRNRTSNKSSVHDVKEPSPRSSSLLLLPDLLRSSSEVPSGYASELLPEYYAGSLGYESAVDNIENSVDRDSNFFAHVHAADQTVECSDERCLTQYGDVEDEPDFLLRSGAAGGANRMPTNQHASSLLRYSDIDGRSASRPLLGAQSSVADDASVLVPASGWSFWPQWRYTQRTRWLASFCVPKYKFAIMGALFSTANFLLFSGMRGELVPGPVAVLLQQSVVPATFALSVLALGRRFNVRELIGALLVVAGIVVTLWPQLLHAQGLSVQHWYAVGLVLSAAVPLSAAAVFMERALQDADRALQVAYMWCWLNVFEFLFAWPLSLGMVPIQNIPVAAIPENLRDGVLCLVFGDEAVHNPAANHVHKYDFQCQDHSSIGNFLLFVLFIAALLAAKLVQGHLVQEESSALMWLAAAAAVPFSELGFCISAFLPGDCHTTAFTWSGLAIVVVGLLCYKWPVKSTVALTMPSVPIAAVAISDCETSE